MRHVAFILTILTLSVAVAACGGNDDTEPDATPGPSTEALDYLEEALGLIEQNWVYADRVNWEAVRSETRAEIDNAESPEDTYQVIRNFLRSLSDPHSFFVPPQDVAAVASPSLTAPLNANARHPTGELLNGRLGLVRLPELTDLGETADLYRRTGVETIESLDSVETCGWIIDVRGNRGGRMWSMITAVGPILGNGEIGALISRDGERIVWEYRDGDGIAGGEVVTSPPTYELINPAPPVAVLIDDLTGSAAEGVAVAFRNRPEARLFGESTAGVATVPLTFELSDGAALVLAGAWMADREGTTFDGPIEPDVLIENEGALSTRTPVEEDEILQAAMGWLMDSPHCQSS